VEGREEEPADPGHPHQRGVSLGTHSCPICQRPVDGQTTIISHGGDEEALSGAQTDKGKKLGCTCRQGNLLGAHHGVRLDMICLWKI
jgi:hypothetical protein